MAESDSRLKQDISSVPTPLTMIRALNPVIYHWKDDPLGRFEYGYIAQEFFTVFPLFTINTDNGTSPIGPQGPWQIDDQPIGPVLVGAMKSLDTTVQTKISETVSAEGDLGALTWSALTSPTGTVTKKYRWSQQGKLVTVNFTIKASIAGVTVTAVAFALPADCPLPLTLSNQADNSWVSMGSGTILSGIAVTLSNGALGLFKTTGNNYEIRVQAGVSLAASYVSGTLTYMTT